MAFDLHWARRKWPPASSVSIATIYLATGAAMSLLCPGCRRRAIALPISLHWESTVQGVVRDLLLSFWQAGSILMP